MDAYTEVRKLLDQIRAVSSSPVVEKYSDQIEVLCKAYMEPDSEAHRYGLTKSLASMFDLLKRREGQMVRSQALMNVADRNSEECECEDATLRVQIWRLRKRLKPHGFEIETIWGAGYRMTRAAEMKMAA